MIKIKPLQCDHEFFNTIFAAAENVPGIQGNNCSLVDHSRRQTRSDDSTQRNLPAALYGSGRNRRAKLATGSNNYLSAVTNPAYEINLPMQPLGKQVTDPALMEEFCDSIMDDSLVLPDHDILGFENQGYNC